MELIDRNKLGIGRCNPNIMLDRAYAAGWNGVINIIKAASIIDPVHAAGACYCRECKSARIRDDMGADFYECSQNGVTVFCNGGHFCGYGKRRTPPAE